MKPKAVLYSRFSSRPGASECESIITQLDRLRAYGTASDWEVIAEKDDADKTGATTNGRPGLAEALDIACKHKATLIVYSLSRLARSTRDAIAIVERLGKCGAELVSLHERIDTTSPMGRFVFRMFASLDELERERTAERTSDAMRRKQADGQLMGGVVPYGYKAIRGEGRTSKGNFKKRLIPDEQEQANLNRIKELAAEGKRCTAIATILNKEKRKGRKRRWHQETVRRIMKRLGI
jgi:site-specific DNA recombinase